MPRRARERCTTSSILARPGLARCERPSSAPSSAPSVQPGRLAQGPEEKSGFRGRTSGFMKPLVRPRNPDFSSGPCAKRPGWTLGALEGALLGRSHRAKPGRAKIDEVVQRSRALLGIPADYRVGIVPASDTGAIEMAMWSLLGARGVDVLAWESFGEGWATDVAKQLKL